MTKPTPSIFDYATKEFILDAVFCWLFAWAGRSKDACEDDRRQERLRDCGRHLLRALLNLKRGDDVQLPDEIDICPRRQQSIRKGGRVDVIADIVDRKTGWRRVLLIENKLKGQDPGDALKDYCNGTLAEYLEAVRDGGVGFEPIDASKIHAVLFQGENQCRASDDEIYDACGFRVFRRKELMDILESFREDDFMLGDFLKYWESIQADTESYRAWTEMDCPTERSERGWQGLFERVERVLSGGRGSVARYSKWYDSTIRGQRRPYHFHWEPIDGAAYLRVEQNGGLRFMVAGWYDGWMRDRQVQELDKWISPIEAASDGAVTRRGLHRRVGKTMPVWEWTEQWMVFDENSKILDVDGTVRKVRRAGKIIEEAAEAVRKIEEIFRKGGVEAEELARFLKKGSHTMEKIRRFLDKIESSHR